MDESRDGPSTWEGHTVGFLVIPFITAIVIVAYTFGFRCKVDITVTRSETTREAWRFFAFRIATLAVGYFAAVYFWS